MKQYHIAIIGAGIVGLYLAWKLSKMGHRVTVFEKKDSIGKEACSGLFSERILGFVPQSQFLVQNQIESVLVHFPKKTVNVKFSKSFLLMSHAKLDRLVADLARESGAKIILNHNCSSSNLQQFKTKFDRVIGCDGFNSIVRNFLGLKAPQARLGILGFIPEKDNSNIVETWAVKNGFIWKIPRGDEQEYGVISSPNEAKNILDGFLKKENIKIERITSSLIPQGLTVPRNNSITLCGDSAGLTKPWSGGGVIWGLMAADILLDSFPDFSKYHRQVKRYFCFKIIILKVFTNIVYFFGFKAPWLLPNNVKIESDAIFSGLIRSTRKNK